MIHLYLFFDCHLLNTVKCSSELLFLSDLWPVTEFTVNIKKNSSKINIYANTLNIILAQILLLIPQLISNVKTLTFLCWAEMYWLNRMLCEIGDQYKCNFWQRIKSFPCFTMNQRIGSLWKVTQMHPCVMITM